MNATDRSARPYQSVEASFHQHRRQAVIERQLEAEQDTVFPECRTLKELRLQSRLSLGRVCNLVFFISMIEEIFGPIDYSQSPPCIEINGQNFRLEFLTADIADWLSEGKISGPTAQSLWRFENGGQLPWPAAQRALTVLFSAVAGEALTTESLFPEVAELTEGQRTA